MSIGQKHIPASKGSTRINNRNLSPYERACLGIFQQELVELGVWIRRVLPVAFYFGFHIIIQVFIVIPLVLFDPLTPSYY